MPKNLFLTAFCLFFAQFVRADFADLKVPLLNGRVTTIRHLAGPKGMVIVARDGTCPIGNRFGPKLGRLEREYTKEGFGFVYLYVGQVEVAKQVEDDRTRFLLKAPYLIDTNLKVAEFLKLETTTEVVVLNESMQETYRGSLDNQYEIKGTRTHGVKNFLQDALNAMLAGKKPKVAKSKAPGCVVNYPPKDKKHTGGLRFSRDIYPILSQKCLSCHHAKVSPIDLSYYEAVKGRAQMIKYVLEKKIMPPWAVKDGLGPWLNDFSLSPSDRSKLIKWLDSEQAEGEERAVPAFVRRAGLGLGEPDVVIRIPKSVRVLREGVMPYQHFIVESPFKKDVWVRAYQIATVPQVAHHVVFHVLKDNMITDPDQFHTNYVSRFGWVRGNDGSVFPSEAGALIPAGAKIAITIHYQPNGEALIDNQTQLELFLHKSLPSHRVLEWSIIDNSFRIPALASSYKSVKEIELKQDAKLIAVNTHMHLRGKGSKITMYTPKGGRETLLEVDGYDFNHQYLYEYLVPKNLHKGARVTCENVFDNSDKNPFNPDPNVEVSWGEQSSDEMSICNLFVMVRNDQ